MRRCRGDASIYSDDAIFAHLGMHPKAAIDFTGQEYLIYDIVEDAPLWKSPGVQRLVASGKYRIVTQNGNVIVLRRSGI